ncbi:vomeronasal type-1 receptor 4-like [Meriones unguiculatus]|uniref:vomeronasal type-1 receptor 4-like n=1 Tax=Meriones unguiculatus TaxID=10047 RepID=UPI00293E6E7D|nr:vomeronasal type-1 receptor 4-like [Meriones unguiculatus]
MNQRMDFWNLAIRIIFLSQTTTGIFGNFSLLFYYLILYHKECILKPTDLILMHLMAANALIVLTAGVPETIAVWGLKQFLNNFGCELLLYIQRFGRSMSICTTCLLSLFQVMTISPRKSCWQDHKVKAVKYIGCSIFLIWVLYILIHFIFLLYPFMKMKNTNVTRIRDFGYCLVAEDEKITDLLYAALVMCPEFFFSVLIAWSSGFMIVILYRHKQRVQHIRSSHGSSRKCPEFRATQNILTLLSTFLAFYTLSSILRGCIALLYNHSWWLMNISRLISLGFPSFGPFVLMNHYSNVVWIRNKSHLILF